MTSVKPEGKGTAGGSKSKDAPLQLRVPPSKSLTQRALLISSLSPGKSRVFDPLDCDDSRVLMEALQKMGVSFRHLPPSQNAVGGVEVEAPESLRLPQETLFLNNAGTAVRFLTALSPVLLMESLGAPLRIDGVEAMRRRPMPGLLSALESLGVQTTTPRRAHCPPLELSRDLTRAEAIWGANVRQRPVILLDPSGSSQQLSGLLMMAPRLPQGLEIHLTAPLPSSPYVDLTLEVMEAFGVQVEWDRDPAGGRFCVPGGGYAPARYTVEGDHSSASYLLAASALTGRRLGDLNVSSSSKQGDRVFKEILEDLQTPGAKRVDMHRCPDVAPTALAYALFRHHPTQIVNVSHLKIKECDRIQVLANELSKLGAQIHPRDDGWEVTPAPLSGPATLDPHGDHRMAMVFGLIALRVGGLKISEPGCVDKSFGNYWEVLEAFE